jgi:hypothetical protein
MFTFIRVFGFTNHAYILGKFSGITADNFPISSGRNVGNEVGLIGPLETVIVSIFGDPYSQEDIQSG